MEVRREGRRGGREGGEGGREEERWLGGMDEWEAD